jgi:hypothetical protein
VVNVEDSHFSESLGAELQQINAEYEAPEEEVSSPILYFLMILLDSFLTPFISFAATGRSRA